MVNAEGKQQQTTNKQTTNKQQQTTNKQCKESRNNNFLVE